MSFRKMQDRELARRAYERGRADKRAAIEADREGDVKYYIRGRNREFWNGETFTHQGDPKTFPSRCDAWVEMCMIEDCKEGGLRSFGLTNLNIHTMRLKWVKY